MQFNDKTKSKRRPIPSLKPVFLFFGSFFLIASSAFLLSFFLVSKYSNQAALIQKQRKTSLLQYSISNAQKKFKINKNLKRERIKKEQEIVKNRDSYGWTDETKNFAHVPINRAIDIFLKHNLLFNRGNE